jgi:hypothetical protein
MRLIRWLTGTHFGAMTSGIAAAGVLVASVHWSQLVWVLQAAALHFTK